MLISFSEFALLTVSELFVTIRDFNEYDSKFLSHLLNHPKFASKINKGLKIEFKEGSNTSVFTAFVASEHALRDLDLVLHINLSGELSDDAIKELGLIGDDGNFQSAKYAELNEFEKTCHDSNQMVVLYQPEFKKLNISKLKNETLDSITKAIDTLDVSQIESLNLIDSSFDVKEVNLSSFKSLEYFTEIYHDH